MYKVEKWVAINGKEFDSEEECHYYEIYLDLTNPDFFKFFDDYGYYVDLKNWLEEYYDFNKWSFRLMIEDLFQSGYFSGIRINCNDAECHPGMDIVSKFLGIYTNGFYAVDF